jgi:hypothetical protein
MSISDELAAEKKAPAFSKVSLQSVSRPAGELPAGDVEDSPPDADA